MERDGKNTLLGTDEVIIWEDGDANVQLNQTETTAATEFAELFEADYQKLADIKEGKIITGTITSVSSDVIIVDIGHKTDGEIPAYEFKNIDGKISVKAGDEIEIFLETFENRHGQLILSYEKAEVMKSWNKLGEAFENEEVVTGKIVRRVKGGLHVDIGVRAFLPGSQIDLRPVKNLDDFVGETFEYKIIKFNKARSNVVLSRRVLLEINREQTRSETLKRLQEGTVVQGIVKNLTDYGAFVDLGGVDGLLHITDMSWGRVNHPSQIFDVGQEIKVSILTFDPKSMRVSLGYKQLLEDPWKTAVDKYQENTVGKGLVVSLTDYGAFVELEDGVEGLIHISEMSWSKRIKHPSKVVSIGDEVECMILGIDPHTRRISLGLKQLEENPWHDIEKKYQVGDVIKGQVRNITDFGIFVAVKEGVDALVHVSDISWVERIKRPEELFHIGQEIEAMVLQIDTREEKFSLSIKQLTPDPWLEVAKSYTPGSKHEGTISKIMNFGVFVRIDQGFDGLIHISELGLDDGLRTYDAYKVDDKINFAVLSIDNDQRKISLSKVAFEISGDELDTYIDAAKSSRLNPTRRHRSYSAPRHDVSSPSAAGDATTSTSSSTATPASPDTAIVPKEQDSAALSQDQSAPPPTETTALASEDDKQSKDSGTEDHQENKAAAATEDAADKDDEAKNLAGITLAGDTANPSNWSPTEVADQGKDHDQADTVHTTDDAQASTVDATMAQEDATEVAASTPPLSSAASSDPVATTTHDDQQEASLDSTAKASLAAGEVLTQDLAPTASELKAADAEDSAHTSTDEQDTAKTDDST